MKKLRLITLVLIALFGTGLVQAESQVSTEATTEVQEITNSQEALEAFEASNVEDIDNEEEVVAKKTYYQVEVIVFTNNNKEKTSSKSVERNCFSDYQEHRLGEEYLLDREQLKLSHESEKIEKSTAYELLVHQGWYQVLPENNEESIVYIKNDNDNILNDIPGLEGVIKFVNNKMHYIKTDFRLRTRADDKDLKMIRKYNLPEIMGYNEFKLSKSSKIKNKNLYYFDNPNFGILFYIEKLDKAPE